MASKLTSFALKSAKSVQLSQIVRPMSTMTPISKNLQPHIQKKQHTFQSDDSTPVYIKGGTVDNVLYRVTMGLCVVSLALIAKSMIQMAMPKKK